MAWRASGKENVRPKDGANREPFSTASRPRRQPLTPATHDNIQGEGEIKALKGSAATESAAVRARCTPRTASEPKLFRRVQAPVATTTPRSRSAVELDVEDVRLEEVKVLISSTEVGEVLRSPPVGQEHGKSGGHLNLLDEVTAALGDPEVLILPLLRARPAAPRYDFKKKMAEQEQLLRDMRDALEQQRAKQLALPAVLNPLQERFEASLRDATEAQGSVQTSKAAAAAAKEEVQQVMSQMHDIDEMLRASRNKIAQLEAELQRQKEANFMEIQRREDMEVAFNDQRAQLSKVQAALDAAKDREQRHSVLAAQLEERVAQQERMNADLRSNMQSMQDMHRSHCEQAQFERERIRELEQRTREMADTEDALRERLRAAAADADRKDAEIGEGRKREADFMVSLKAANEEKERLEAVAADNQGVADSLRTQLESTQQNLAQAKEVIDDERKRREAETQRAEILGQEKLTVEVEYRSFKEHHGTSDQQQLAAITDLRVEVERLNKKMERSQSELREQQGDVALKNTCIRTLEGRLSSSEQARRELHNQIQELKGNIRVFCRMRPSSETSHTSDMASSLRVPDVGKLQLSHAGENYNFNLDRVFQSSSGQEDIFEEVSGLVQSALDGYKVCIFAYGQTGSGKTYTMQGLQDPPSWGIIPRAMKKIFEECQVSRSQGWEWTLQASFIEVYNEQLRDLLRAEGATPVQPGGAASTSSTSPVHVIKQDDAWGTIVTNVAIVDVSSMSQISSLMAKAARQRAVGCTDMNSVSSRSHSIFALYLRGTHHGLGSELLGALHLVDLAGSERLDRSGATGERLKETQNINRSLSSLADVFLAKAEGRGHVPFRNSKLTHLMEPCLSGHGKTLMVVNISPEEMDVHETLCSLRFAGQVSQCDSGGKPKRSAKLLQAGSATPPATGGGTPSAFPRSATPPQRAASTQAAPFALHTARRARQ